MSSFNGTFEAISNAADWQDAVDCTDENGDAIDLTGCTIAGELVAPIGNVVLRIGTDTGEITITSGQFEILVTAAVMKGVPAAIYRFNARLTTADGDVDQLFTADIQVIDGGFH